MQPKTAVIEAHFSMFRFLHSFQCLTENKAQIEFLSLFFSFVLKTNKNNSIAMCFTPQRFVGRHYPCKVAQEVFKN
jgi:hypothetical protein